MKRKIITDIRILKQKSEKILFNGIEPQSCEGVERIIKDLEDSLDLTKGIGLSAVQIGVLKKVAIIRMPNLKLDLINPVLCQRYDRFRFIGESCLSLPGLAIDTARYKYTVVINNNREKLVFAGLEAVAVQHEIDHLDGLTILDRKWRKR